MTQSQILSVAPARLQEPPTPPRPSRPVEMSMWGGKVLAADDFAPDAGRKVPRRGRVALVVVVGGLLAAGGWLWHSRPKLPWMSAAAPASQTKTAAASSVPAVAAPAPAVAAPAPVETTPSPPAPVVKTVHAKKPAKLASSRHHHKSSRTKKHSHAKSIRSTAPTDG